MKKIRRTVLLLLPLLLAYILQATQYARAPVKYGYFIVYAKNADIALKPGDDLGPNGQTLLQNSTSQQGLYNLSLGNWGPGYQVNYTYAFNITNREVFNITMVGFNFTAASTGQNYLKMYVLNDTNGDGYGDAEILAWDGTSSSINATRYIFFIQASSYGNDGGTSKVKVMMDIPETSVTLQQYTGTLLMWFKSATF